VGKGLWNIAAPPDVLGYFMRRLFDTFRASFITVTKLPPETNPLFKDLQNILVQIHNHDTQYGENGFFPHLHEIASEIDEIKFGIYILAAATQGKISLVPLDYLRRTVFRVLQLLHNPDEHFNGKEQMRNWIEEAYNLLKTDEMPHSKEVFYDVKQDNHLFYIHQNPEFFALKEKNGLFSYFVKSNVKVVESNLNEFQKILHRLTYYLSNFNYPAEWVKAFENLFSCTNNKNVRKRIKETAFAFKNSVDPDSFVQLCVLCCVVLTDSDPETNKEAFSCYYWKDEYRNVLISLAAKLPASIVLKQVKLFLGNAERVGEEYPYFNEAFSMFEDFFNKKPIPIRKSPDKSIQEQSIALIAKTLVGKNFYGLLEIGNSMLKALEHNNLALALLHFGTLSKEQIDWLNRQADFQAVRYELKVNPETSQVIDRMAKTLISCTDAGINKIGHAMLLASESKKYDYSLQLFDRLFLLSENQIKLFNNNSNFKIDCELLTRKREYDTVQENAHSHILEKYFDQMEAGILLKKAFLPKGLNANLSIEPIVLIGAMEEFTFIANDFISELSKQNQIDSGLIQASKIDENSLSYTIHYDERIENLLDIEYKQEPGEAGSVSIKLSLNCLSKDQITSVLSSLILTLHSFFEHVDDRGLSNIKNLKMLKYMDDTTHALNSLLRDGFSLPEILETNLAQTFNHILEFKKEQDTKKSQREWGKKLVQVAIEEIEGILEFHKHADLTLWHSKEPELPMPQALSPRSPAANQVVFFPAANHPRTAGDMAQLENKLGEYFTNENSIN
jgi:hypothetical protein